METPFIISVRDWSFDQFRKMGKKHGDDPYETHLELTASYGRKYLHLLPEEDREAAMAACYGHDDLEDIPDLTYNDFKKVLSRFTTDLRLVHLTIEAIQGCSNHTGRDRIERGVPAWIAARRHPLHKFVKITDRLANTSVARHHGSSFLKMYQKEYPCFRFILKDPVGGEDFNSMWYDLDEVTGYAQQPWEIRSTRA